MKDEWFVSKPAKVRAWRVPYINTLTVYPSWIGDSVVRKHLDLIEFRVYDYLHRSWINFRAGDWIIEGTKCELYPCDNEVFEQKYARFTEETVIKPHKEAK